MSEFMPDPTRILADKTELLAALTDLTWYEERNARDCATGRSGILSLWLYDLINQLKAEGELPYNAQVKQRATAELGFPPGHFGPDHVEGNPLSSLIYNAQNYVRSDTLRGKGFAPATEEMLLRCMSNGYRVEVKGSICRLKHYPSGSWFAMPPRHTRTGYPLNTHAIHGTAIRVLEGKS